jgi:hypothetical protein
MAREYLVALARFPPYLVSGHTGFHGVNLYVNVGIGQILKHVNAIFSFAGEARKGRFGLLGDLLDLNGQASSFSDLGFHGVSFMPQMCP